MDYQRNRNEGMNPNMHPLIPAVRGSGRSGHVGIINAPPGMKDEQAAGITPMVAAPAAARPAMPQMPLASRQEQSNDARMTIKDQLHLAQRSNFYASVARNNNQAAMNQRLRGVYGDNTKGLNQSRLDVESQQQGVDPYASQYRQSAENRADAQSNADVGVKGGQAAAYHGQAKAFEGQGDMYRGQGEAYRGQGEAYRGEAAEHRANATTLIPSTAAVNNAQANIAIPAQANVANSQAGVNHAQAGMIGEQQRDVSATRPARIAGIQGETENAHATTQAGVERSRVQNRNDTVTADSGAELNRHQGGLIDAQTGQVTKQTTLMGQPAPVSPGDAAAAEDQRLKSIHDYPDEYAKLHPGANTSIPAGPTSFGDAIAPHSIGQGIADVATLGGTAAWRAGQYLRQPSQPQQQQVPQGVSEEDIQHTMQARGLTRDQVLAQLKARSGQQ